jgi:predicted Zn-dependent protease
MQGVQGGLPVKRSVAVFGATGVLIIVGALFFRPPASAEAPRLPHDDSEVLERLPAGASDVRERQREQMRRALAAHPNDLRTALTLARLDVQLSRARSDPRYLGYAQAALGPWWDLPSPPVEVMVLRATIRQSLHDFDGALRDLDRVVALAPDNAQAWITRSVVLSVRGRYEEARASCKPLEHLAPELVFTVCETSIDGVTGAAGPAYERLEAALLRSPMLSPAENEWATSTLGEIALRLGRDADAEKSFKAALAIDPDDAYVLAAYADLLLDLHRPAEAARLVAGRTDNDGLLLRLALAETKSRVREAGEHTELLAGRFEASHLRGDTVHRREEARFQLGLRDDARAALALARANWDVQREPWDVRVFLEAAAAARAAAAAQPVVAFLDEHHLEDPRIAELAAKLRRSH